MKSVTFLAYSVVFAAAVSLTFAVSGCAPKKTPRRGGGDDGGEESTKPKTAIKPGTASIKGKIVFGAARPNYDKTADILSKPDCVNCKIPEGKKYWDADQKWIVGPELGVANAVVRLKIPDSNSYFETSEADKQKAAKEQVVLDQQCCNFDPHVLVVFPYYTDGKTNHPTGQVLLIKNTGSMLHNTNFGGGSGNSENFVVASETERKYVLNPQNSKAIPVTCSVHQWMNAKVFAYDHPYAMRTTESGEFELKNVNVGTALTVEIWHESLDDVETRTVTLSENEKKDLGTITIGK